MGIMNYLRERMGKILAIVIGLALFAFIAGEVVKTGSSIFRGSDNNIGEVSGESITNEDFHKKLDIMVKNMEQQYGQAASPQLTAYAQENTWTSMVSDIILKKEIDKLGIIVGVDETRNMISGDNPNPQIVQTFGDPKTGKVDKIRMNQFLSNVQTAKDGDPMKQQWADFVSNIIDQKRKEKYVNLVRGGLYVNTLDAKDDYEAKNKLVNFKYAQLDYASVADNTVTPTDDDYQTYYNEHKGQFKNPSETRSFNYVSFSAAPSKEDSALVKKQIDTLVAGLKASTNDSLFVQIHADTKTPLTFQRKGQLDTKLDSVMFTAEKGAIVGPYYNNGSYKLAKLVDSRVGPDSVKASHILISPQLVGGADKAKAKADSIKKLIAGGASFGELAKKFSADTASGKKDGDLGTFGRGAMVPAFEEAAFGGKVGDLKTVTTQFGIHIIKIVAQKGSSKMVKVAVVDKHISASSKTQSAAYAKAQTFLSGLTKDNFDAQAKAQGAQVKHADDILGTAQSVPGLESAREIVKFVFVSKPGDLPEQVYTSGNDNVIPVLATIKPAGQLSLVDVKKQIEPQVRLAAKAKMLAAKFNGALSAGNIDAVAAKVGTAVVPVQNVVFANPVIPGFSAEYKVVGTLFGSPLNKVSKPIEGQHGVYIVSVDGFVNPAPMTNAVRQKTQLSQALDQRTGGQAYEALKDKANVKDNRAKLL